MSLDIYLTENTCPTCGRGDEVFAANITHNLTDMADEADLYGPLWRPEENGVTTAQDLIAPLETGIAAMRADPPRFNAHDSPNGWGTYKVFLPWLKNLLEACRENPTATVRVSR